MSAKVYRYYFNLGGFLYGSEKNVKSSVAGKSSRVIYSLTSSNNEKAQSEKNKTSTECLTIFNSRNRALYKLVRFVWAKLKLALSFFYSQ